MANLLVVEDDYNTNEAICEYMKMVGHNTLSVFDGVQAVITLQENHIDLAYIIHGFAVKVAESHIVTTF